jgi:peptidoglycan/LPS O-acetylase OafA/YrhL
VLPYRADIDGLRGVAIAAVLIYQGGFGFGRARLIVPSGLLRSTTRRLLQKGTYIPGPARPVVNAPSLLV